MCCKRVLTRKVRRDQRRRPDRRRRLLLCTLTAVRRAGFLTVAEEPRDAPCVDLFATIYGCNFYTCNVDCYITLMWIYYCTLCELFSTYNVDCCVTLLCIPVKDDTIAEN